MFEPGTYPPPRRVSPTASEPETVIRRTPVLRQPQPRKLPIHLPGNYGSVEDYFAASGIPRFPNSPPVSPSPVLPAIPAPHSYSSSLQVQPSVNGGRASKTSKSTLGRHISQADRDAQALQPSLAAHLATLKKARQNVDAQRRSGNRFARFFAQAGGFTATAFATVAAVAAIAKPAAILMFAAPHVAIPLTVGVAAAALLVALAGRFYARWRVQKDPSVQTDVASVHAIKADVEALQRQNPTGAQANVLREANAYLTSVHGASNDFAKTLGNVSEGIFWPATLFMNFLNLRRKKA
jgi:hypothetical protein